MDDQNRNPDDKREFAYGQDPFKKEEDASRPERQDPYAGYRGGNEPYTYGPYGRPQPYRTAEEWKPAEPERTEPTQQVREYRPFTVSGGSGRGGSWQAPPKRTSLRAVFASFMVGVIAVGGLMFAADQGNWFSQGAQAAPASTAASGAKTASAAVSNAADVVRPNNIAQIFEKASPAVVKIETYVKASSRRSSSMDDLFEQFFGQVPDGSDSDNGGDGSGSGSLQASGMGSGFIFDSTGYILTNQHVIANADDIEVTVIGHNKPFKAKLLGSSYDLDLAVLKIEGTDGTSFPTLKLGDSAGTNMGDWVVAIGNPYGFDHTVTVGVLSANEREISIQDQDGTRNYQHLLQTDASINPGNSGGPLLNLNGDVIGINTAVSSEAQGIGFAIPTSTITEVIDDLKANKEIPKPFIGASLQTLTPEIAKKLGLSGTEGSMVVSVVFGSPAYKADLRAYDVITGMDGTAYKDNASLIAAIQKKKIGDKVTLNVIRNGEKIDVQITIGNRNDFDTGNQQ
ncbi:S1C family serine protease [Cohnella caldifontis]|uniref:S1C family serine protease n=1 Tax=Cohnella caldifontis TaxID=3027471 RepID=UPI0023EC39F0|nr:trypsin-like peptidase domain-containing protein [Cohnella sp. YIM B05605]